MNWSSIGVPDVPNVSKAIGDSLISFGGATLVNAMFGNYWGVFNQNGIPLLLADNVAAVRYDRKSQLSNAPVENGSFATYNKVAQPFTAVVRMTKGSGGSFERGAFLALLNEFAESTDLYMIITPEAVYPNCNIVGYSYSREARDGARLIKVDIQFQEVRQVSVAYTKTRQPAASATAEGGAVQAKVATTPASSAANNVSLLKRGADWAMSILK